MASDTLVYNSADLEELAGTVAGDLKQFVDNVDGMFNVIDKTMNQPEHWSGTTYEGFRDKCDNFRVTEIERVMGNIQAFVNHFHKTSVASEETTNSVKGIVTRDAIANSNAINTVGVDPNGGQTGGTAV